MTATDTEIATAARAYVEAEAIFMRGTRRGKERDEWIARHMDLVALCRRTDDEPGVLAREVTVERVKETMGAAE
jgi:hypothetical protein